MDLNMEVLISRSPGMGESDSVAEEARTEEQLSRVVPGATTELPSGRKPESAVQVSMTNGNPCGTNVAHGDGTPLVRDQLN